MEWEYLPPIGPRPHKGFVGLKNAGATCYMNSVLQQMFMIEPIRTYLLAAEGAADDFEEEDNDKPEAEVIYHKLRCTCNAVKIGICFGSLVLGILK